MDQSWLQTFSRKNKSWKEIVASTKSGPAKYSQEIESIEAFEREAWNSGIPVTNGKNWKVKKYGNYSVGLRNPQIQHKVENWKGTEKIQRNVNIQEGKKVVC